MKKKCCLDRISCKHVMERIEKKEDEEVFGTMETSRSEEIEEQSIRKDLRCFKIL